jgi:dTDP-4-dehydrorhamnose reductase
MKVLVTGYKGQLGYDVVKALEKLNIECLGVDIDEFDLTKEEQVINFILDYKPTAVIHCAAYTAVDNAEVNQKLCYDVNVNGSSYIAKGCSIISSKLIFISTDYVFSGDGKLPFKENDKKNPINYYGYTKSIAEDKIQKTLDNYFIVRISWAFGKNGNNFVKSIIKNAKEKGSLKVVNDQIGSPTYTYDLAKLLCEIVQSDKYGIYHATNEGYCSWYDFAMEIVKISNIKCDIETVTTKEYITKAKRSLNSRLAKTNLEKNGFSKLTNWKIALKHYIINNY